MGYTTDFSGEFKLDRPLSEKHRLYLKRFNETRHMGRYEHLIPPPGKRKFQFHSDEAVLENEVEGETFIDDECTGIIDYNEPPKGCPSLWCQWVPNSEGTTIEWDGGEKFYEYTAWIKYMIIRFFNPAKYVLNGEVTWFGEDSMDHGKIVIVDNVVTEKIGVIVYR